MNIRKERISDITLGGLDMADYPDFVDAYVEDCLVDGNPASSEQLDAINEADYLNELVQENAHNQLF